MSFPTQYYGEYEKVSLTENFDNNKLYIVDNIDKEIYKLLKESIVPIDDVIYINTEQVYKELCEIKKSLRFKGVYILIFEHKKPYIGSTKNIYVRLREHRRTYNNILSIIFLKTKDMEDALLLEDWLTRNLVCSNKCHVIPDNFWYGSQIRKDKKTTI